MNTISAQPFPHFAKQQANAPQRIFAVAQRQPVLTLSVLVNLALFVVAIAGMLFDPHTVLGAPTWTKTVKFTISIALYCGTLIWVLNRITQRPRLVRFIGNATGALLLLEIAIIAIQAARGVPSHFNYTTWLDSAMFITMGAGITSMWVIDVIAFVLLMRERMQSRAMAAALRFGMLIALIGMALAFTMTGPNSTQIAALTAGQKLSILGAHNVNAIIDGQTRMIPFLGWNRDGGDLRIAHFIGLHAIQVIPLLGLWLERRRARWLGDDARASLIAVASATYLGVTLLTLWQALRNESIATPGAMTFGGFAVVLSLTAIATAAIITRARAEDRRSPVSRL